MSHSSTEQVKVTMWVGSAYQHGYTVWSSSLDDAVDYFLANHLKDWHGGKGRLVCWPRGTQPKGLPASLHYYTVMSDNSLRVIDRVAFQVSEIRTNYAGQRY